MNLLSMAVVLLLITMVLSYCMSGQGGNMTKGNSKMCMAKHDEGSKEYDDCMTRLQKGGILGRGTMTRKDAEELKKQLDATKDLMKQFQKQN